MSVIIYIFSFFISIKIIICRNINLTTFQILSEYKPVFLQEEIKPSFDTFYLSLEYLSWFPHQISYKVYLSEINNDIYYSDEYIFDDYKHTKEEIELYIKNNGSLWNNWNLHYEGNERILKIDNINKNSKYRIKYQIISKYSSSKESDIKIVTLKHRNNKINIYIKGTGRNNHDNAEIYLNSIKIFEHGKYQGLACIVLNRKDLSFVDVELFDFFNNHTVTSTIYEDFINYSYDNDGNIVKNVIRKKVTKDNVLSVEQKFENFLKRIKMSQLLIIVSCYGWEKYFTYQAAERLSNFGALKIKELAKSFYFDRNEDDLNGNDILGKNLYFHPYVFMGIKNIGQGNGYEVVQSNKGHYLTTEGLIPAEIIVTMKYNKYNMAYFFDREQKFQYLNNLINYHYLYNSLDFSLKNLFPFLITANQTTKNNLHFNIYNENKHEVIMLPESALTGDNRVYQTELDRVVYGNNIGGMRTKYNGEIYQNGKSIKELEYYDFYMSAWEGKNCLPPYIPNGKECISPYLVDNYIYDIPLIMCKIGVEPQICKNNNDYILNNFQGFD